MTPPAIRLMAAALVSAAAAALACNTGDEHSEEHQHAARHPEGDLEPRQDAERVVRIERGMLRDLRVTTQPAESRPAGDTLTVLGEVRVNEDAYAEIGTSIVARVSRVLAAPGDVVAAGQPLVELDSPEVGRARAQVITSRARLELARQAAERRRALSADQIISRREMQATEAELVQAEADHRAAQASLGGLGAERGAGARFVLSSPIAGTVIERGALLGRMVDAERPLFVVGDLSRLWLIVHAFERDALRMRTGASARVVFSALPGQHVTGAVARVASQVDPTSRTVDVRVELDNPSGVLRPGMSGTASIAIGDATQKVVAVPVAALQRLPEGWCVFIPRAEEGVFDIRVVGRGRDLGGEVEVVSGLRAGEVVVVDGAFLLKAEADKARGAGAGEHSH